MLSHFYYGLLGIELQLYLQGNPMKKCTDIFITLSHFFMVQEPFVFLFQSIMASNAKSNTACLNVNRSNTQLLLFRFQIVPQSFAQTPSTPKVSNYATQQQHMGKSLPIGVKKPGISARCASTVNNSSHVLKLTK